MISIKRDALILMGLAVLIFLTQLTVLRQTNKIEKQVTAVVEGCR